MLKSETTREFIVDTSTKIFAQKGYAIVTMTDICEACSMSRGGVYRYFGSTKEIFIAMLEKDMDEGRTAVAENIAKGVSSAVIFDHFLMKEKKAIFNKDRSLYFVIHEFAFYEVDQQSYFQERLRGTIEILSEIFKHGQGNGEFKDFDVEVMANHVIYFLDSLKTSSTLFPITEHMIDAQFKLLKEMIVCK